MLLVEILVKLHLQILEYVVKLRFKEVDVVERKAAKKEMRATKRARKMMIALRPWHQVRKKAPKPKVCF